MIIQIFIARRNSVRIFKLSKFLKYCEACLNFGGYSRPVCYVYLPPPISYLYFTLAKMLPYIFINNFLQKSTTKAKAEAKFCLDRKWTNFLRASFFPISSTLEQCTLAAVIDPGSFVSLLNQRKEGWRRIRAVRLNTNFHLIRIGPPAADFARDVPAFRWGDQGRKLPSSSSLPPLFSLSLSLFLHSFIAPPIQLDSSHFRVNSSSVSQLENPSPLETRSWEMRTLITK